MFCDTGDTVAHLKFRHDATIHATFFGPHMQKLNMMHEYEVIQRVAVPIYCICGHHGSNTVVCSSINNPHCEKVINDMPIQTVAVSSTEI